MESTSNASVSTHHRHQHANITEPPTRFSRWWMRHYQHIGLASMAGSAILVCITVVILLPIVLGDANNNGTCTTIPPPITHTMRPINVSTSTSTRRMSTQSSSSTTSRSVTMNPLCAATAVWKREGVTVAGSPAGVSSSSPTGLNGPNDMLIDSMKNIFIADSLNNRIMCWLNNATEGRLVAGTGFLGSWNNTFGYPAAVEVWQDQLFVSDVRNYRILSFPFTIFQGSPEGVTVIGRDGQGSALTQLNLVYSMVLDDLRQIFYLSDARNNRILRLNLTSNEMQLVYGTGSADSAPTTLNFPLGMAVERTSGAMYVADSRNHRIQRFSLNSVSGQTVAGGRGNGTALNQLAVPGAVALDPQGNVYVADSANHRVIQWLNGASQGRIIAGNGTAGVSQIQLNYPIQVKFDQQHNLYVVDQRNHRIQRFDLLSNGC